VPISQVPRVPPPDIPILPSPPPPLQRHLQVLTLENVTYFAEACDAWKSVGQEGFDTADEVAADYPGLTQEDACGWAIYGRTVGDELAFEQDLERAAGYADELRSVIASLTRQLKSLHEALEKWAEEDRKAFESFRLDGEEDKD